MTQSRSLLTALGLAIAVAASPAMPAVTAAPTSNAAFLRPAAPGIVVQFGERDRNTDSGTDEYGLCLGGRDGDGVPCR